jgi:hypothetical protein
MRIVQAAHAAGPKSAQGGSKRCPAIVPPNGATTPRTGTCRCFATRYGRALPKTFPITRFDALSGGWDTSGSEPDTSWSRTQSARKKRRIRGEIRRLPPRSVLLAEDETDLLLFPPLRANWSLRGEPHRVLLSGWNARRVVFGATNLRNGRRLFLVRRRQKQEDFQAFLTLLHQHYRGWSMTMSPRLPIIAP